MGQSKFKFHIKDVKQVVSITTYTVEAGSREEAFRKLVDSYFGEGEVYPDDIMRRHERKETSVVTDTTGMPWWFGEVTKVDGKPQAFQELDNYMKNEGLKYHKSWKS